MNNQHNQREKPNNEEPPILGTWKNVYFALLVANIFLVVLFILFKNHFS